MNKEQIQKLEQELSALSVDELNQRNELYELQRHALREAQKVLVQVRARRMRQDRMAELDARGGQHVRAGVAEVKGKAVR